jgi:hypothetical protein
MHTHANTHMHTYTYSMFRPNQSAHLSSGHEEVNKRKVPAEDKNAVDKGQHGDMLLAWLRARRPGRLPLVAHKLEAPAVSKLFGIQDIYIYIENLRL